MTARAANIRDAASVLVLRDGPRGMQVLLMRRPERDNDFRSGACVFPGGVLDRGDAAAHRLCIGLDDASASARLGVSAGGLDYFVAALRECFEEVGLLFACDRDGAALDLQPHTEELQQWRHRLHKGEATITGLLEAFDWRLDLRAVAYFAHWLTPVTRPKRFDTRFFVRLAPPGQTAQPDLGEALELMWLTPDEALDPQRGLKLLNVTQRVLHDLRGFADARSAFEHALALRGVALHFPRPALGRNGPRFVIESDEAYAELALLDPDGRGDLRCELVAGDVQQLSSRLWRVAGVRRNAYVVCDSARSEAAIVDADPADDAQLQALRRLAIAPVRWLLATDSGVEAVQGAPLREHWPQAEVPRVMSVPLRLKLGHDCTLRCGADAVGCALEEERIAIGNAADEQTVDSAIEWFAPASGFMRRAAVA